MGIIERSIRDKANQRVAATRTLEVACRLDQLSDTIQGLFDTWNGAADAEYQKSLATRGKFLRWLATDFPLGRHYHCSSRRVVS